MEQLLGLVLQEYADRPVDLFGIGDGRGEARYLRYLRPSFLRTVVDIVDFCRARDQDSVRVLEIGAFLGVVSILLSRLGFSVTAIDIEECMSCQALRDKFDRNGVRYAPCNLRDYAIPFGDEAFDVVVLCEVLEHLNFNPLPVVQEINRVMRTGGLFYVALPNLACLDNRMRLLRGESIHNPINDFFTQFDPNDNMIVGLHWREYTAAEVREMLERMGFDVVRQTFTDREAADTPRRGWSLKGRVMKILYRRLLGVDFDRDPTMKKVQVTFAVKQAPSDARFHFRNATRPAVVAKPAPIRVPVEATA